MRTYISFLAGAALTIAGFAGTILVQGGWQAAAAALAILGGMIFVVGFISLQIAGEQPARARLEWSKAEPKPRALPTAERSPAPTHLAPAPAAARPVAARARHAGT